MYVPPINITMNNSSMHTIPPRNSFVNYSKWLYFRRGTDMCALLPREKYTPQQCIIYLSRQEGAKMHVSWIIHASLLPTAHVYLLSEICNCCKFRSVQLLYMPEQFHVTLQSKSILAATHVYLPNLANFVPHKWCQYHIKPHVTSQRKCILDDNGNIWIHIFTDINPLD